MWLKLFPSAKLMIFFNVLDFISTGHSLQRYLAKLPAESTNVGTKTDYAAIVLHWFILKGWNSAWGKLVQVRIKVSYHDDENAGSRARCDL